ncbi:DUF4139 domain-containing protein [Acetobacteraceae bacterium H6797]|nr:DUF4139 domain-containing protein [Acetobacteraceae bacterium H6797]
MRHAALSLAIALALPWTAASAAELSVRAVTLSSTGLSQIDRAARIGPDEGATLRVPVGDVDDLLKSLVIFDPAGTVLGIRLPALNLAEEAFRGLPFKPEDMVSRIALLSALRGQQVEAGGVSGRLADAADTEQGLRVSIITATGLRAVTLRDGDEVTLADKTLAARLGRAAEAVATAQGTADRQVEIALKGNAAREISVLTVTGAPVWKPSWRLVVPSEKGDARLQGWATIENVSGSDWNGIRLSLVTGEAAALRQALYAPILVPRREVPVRVAQQVTVQADTGAAPPPPPAAEMSMVAPAPAPAAPMRRLSGSAMGAGQAEFANAAQPALTAASQGRIAFTLPEPVTLRSGETANLPFLDATLESERVWWIQDSASRNPLLAASLTNKTGQLLPDGLVTVYGSQGAEQGNWLGDAELRALPPGETRLIAFGRDRDVLVTRSTSNRERADAVSFAPGKVLVRGVRIEETAFAIDPKGAKGPLLIDLPRRNGAKPAFEVSAEGDFGLRHRVMLDGSAVTLRLPFEREIRREVALWDAGLGDPLLLNWRMVDVEPSLSRLPGGPGSLETLRQLLANAPAGMEGRDALTALIADMEEARRLLDAFAAQYRSYETADNALTRARQAVEDRTGAEREAARRNLTRASQDAEQAGARADAAWSAWQAQVRKVMARAG